MNLRMLLHGVNRGGGGGCNLLKGIRCPHWIDGPITFRAVLVRHLDYLILASLEGSSGSEGPPEGRMRDLALFNVAIDSKLRGCDA